MTPAGATCVICGVNGSTRGEIPDENSPTGRWSLWACDRCEVSWSTPLTVPEGYYDAIYGSPKPISGYVRYHRLSRMVARQARPLDYLATQQDVYWAAREFVDALVPEARIVEVGAGLGYLSYAVRRSGRAIVGLDLSEAAVARATARFGGSYRVGDVTHLPEELVGAFDAALALEVIEHTDAPAAFVRGALELLRPGGRLLLTTPDRDIHPAEQAWGTDPPPVHLFWFGRTALQRIAEQVGATVAFLDFSAFNEAQVQLVPTVAAELPRPFLGPGLSPLAVATARERVVEVLDRSPRVGTRLRSALRSASGRSRLTARSSSLAAVLTKGG